MKALLKILVWTSVTAVAALIIAVVIIVSSNANWARPYLNQWISSAIDREFTIRGNLTTGFVFGGPAESGWRRYVPRPHRYLHK